MATSPNFSWPEPDNTDLVKNGALAIRTAVNAIDSSMVDLKGGTTGQILAKATNTDMDFVWVANDVGDITGVTATTPLTGGGTSGAITVGIQDATTSVKGAVQLSDSTSTTSSILAATPTAVKAAYDLAVIGSTTNNNLTMVQQYTATESVLKNIPSRIPVAEQLLKQAVYWIDAAQSDNSDQVLDNQGWGAPALTTQLGSSASADSNDPKFLDFVGINYVYLPGIINNFISTPDATALDITGDIDLRAYVACDDWTPASNGRFITKYNGIDGNYSFAFGINTSGLLTLEISPDGTVASISSVTSSVAPTISDGAALWVRATYRTSDGRVQFFTSADGITYTQLGTDQTSAAASIFNSVSNVEFGTSNVGSGNLIAMKYYRAQILNGIDGTKVLDVDTSVITAGAATSFTALTGQTVTINRGASGRKSVAVVHPVWLFGTDDYMEVNNRWLEHTGSNYLYLPGVASNYASTPDSAALDITGDIDLQVKVALDDWTPAANSALLYKWDNAGSSAAYGLRVNATTGRLILLWTENGSTVKSATSTVSPTVTDGATLWVRATLDVDNGASGNDVIFYTSTNGTIWTQLGTTVTQAGTTSIYSGTSQVEIGGFAGGLSPSKGAFYRAIIKNGIDGTVAFDANFETGITTNLPTTFTESSANTATVTINYSGTGYRSAGVIDAGYLYPGATNTFSNSTIDYLNFGATDSFTILAVARLWGTGSGNPRFIDKATSASNGGYIFYLADSNNRSTLLINDLTTSAIANSSTGLTSGELLTTVGSVNRSTQTENVSNNSVTGSSVSTSSVGSIRNLNTVFRIGAGASTAFMNMEFVGAAVFRSALTTAQIRQISNYFANREAYL